jgi:hypothetical protein
LHFWQHALSLNTLASFPLLLFGAAAGARFFGFLRNAVAGLTLLGVAGVLWSAFIAFPGAVDSGKRAMEIFFPPQAQLVAALEGLPLMPFSGSFVARPDLEAKLHAYMSTRKRPGYLVVVGPRGSGKSTLIGHFFSVGSHFIAIVNRKNGRVLRHIFFSYFFFLRTRQASCGLTLMTC